MEKKLSIAKILASIAVGVALQGTALASHQLEDETTVYSHPNGDKVFPFYPAGIAHYEAKNDQWYLSGLPAYLEDGVVSLNSVKRLSLLPIFTSELGFPVELHDESKSKTTLLLDLTCPYSRGFLREFDDTLSSTEKAEYNIIPVSRDYDIHTFKVLEKLQCIPVDKRYQGFSDYLLNGVDLTEAAGAESCTDIKLHYAQINLFEEYQVKGVPAALDSNGELFNPWEILEK